MTQNAKSPENTSGDKAPPGQTLPPAAPMKSAWGMRLMLPTVIGTALLVIIGVVTLVITGVLPFRKVEFKKLDKPATIDIPSTEVDE